MSRRIDVPETVGILAPFVDAGLLGAGEVHLAAAVERLHREETGVALGEEEILGLALAARAPRLGHVCIEVDRVAERLMGVADDTGGVDLPWPEPLGWSRVLEGSPIVSLAGSEPSDGRLRPLVLDGPRLYLHRYHAYETAVADDLTSRSGSPLSAIDPGPGVLDALFPPAGPHPGEGASPGPDHQRLAAERALEAPVTVIAGGPGTGKTHTISRLLAAAVIGGVRDFALAAPTGKAAARMTEAVRGAVAEATASGAIDEVVAERLRAAEATTIHGLLGARPGGYFGRDRHTPLPHDLIIVDETSMVALPLMARLLDAVAPNARIVLVGDPDQLVSVEAGTVLADLVGAGLADPGGAGPLAGRVTVLERVHRFGAESGIAALADAVRTGDVDAALGLLDRSRDDLVLVDPADADAVVEQMVVDGIEAVAAAGDGRIAEALAAISRRKLLAAVHHGPNGRIEWGHRIGRAVLDGSGDLDRRGDWHIGRPVLVTANDRLNRVSNGDTGIAVRHDGALAVVFPDGGAASGHRLVPPVRLAAVESWWSMTIHKSQGSEFSHVAVALPDGARSEVLTRELLYTAVTRAREGVTIVGTRDAVAAAVARPVARSSGLADRLRTR